MPRKPALVSDLSISRKGRRLILALVLPGGDAMFGCQAGSPRRLTGRFALFLALVLSLFAPSAATAQQGPSLTLIETLPDDGKLWGGNWTVNDGALALDLNGGTYRSQFAWSVPPAQIVPAGFDMTLNVAGQVTSECTPLYAGTGASGVSFEITPDPARADVNLVPPPNCDLQTPAAGSGSVTVHVTPRNSLGDGEIVELKVGAAFGPGVTYRYRVSNPPPVVVVDPPVIDPPVVDPPAEERLAFTIECPTDIVISQQPALQCAIVFTSWRRNTATPVDVSLPGAIDFFGNHANGIQLTTIVGNEDVFNWVAPHRWLFSVFACPSRDNVGFNCYDNVTTPGTGIPVSIIVRQGDDIVPVTLTFDAIAGPGVGPNACGFTLGQTILDKWNATGGEGGFLGCAIGDEQEASRSSSGAEARQALFQGGVIVLHAGGRLAGSAFEVHGSIGARYLGLGGTASWLGLPVSDEYEMPGGRRSDFEGGYIAWDQLTGGSIAMRDGSASISFEPDTNRAGSDFTSFEAIGDRMEICRDACAAESSCVAYTYVRPGLQGPRGMCWLKSSIPEAHLEGCCISGVKR